MGIFNFIKGQFIEVIEWTDPSIDTIVYQFPVMGKEIKMGASLTVRESQAAIFVNEGVIADVFMPGRYELSTQNMPILTKLKSWKYGFNSPFKAEVYFINTKQFTDQKWGTANPVMMRDAEFGMLRLRAFGIFSYRVSDPVVFLKEVFGTNLSYSTENILEQLKRSIVSGLSDLLGESKIPALDLAMHYDELSQAAMSKLQSRFNSLGLEIASFYIENISLPEEVEKVMDRKTSMGIIGNINQYAQYQTAEAIREGANNPNGGLASAGVGLGAGAAMGSFMTEAFKGSEKSYVICPNCGFKNIEGSKFCSNCGKTFVNDSEKCIKCGAEITKGAKFCPECGSQQNIEVFCKGCGKKLDASSKFCPECGTKMQE